MKKLLLLILLINLLGVSLIAQSGPIKYGKVSKEELAIETTSNDSEFGAVILCDFGEIEIANGLLTIHRHVRIKILNQNGLDEANVVLPYFTKGGTEKITYIKAQTLNVDAKGKIKKTPVNKKEIYTSDPNENWKEKRFTFSDVKPGSIIEYQFLKRSERIFSLEPWYFQNQLPTLKSELKVQIAGNLDFRLVYNGNRLIRKYGDSSNQNKWTLENLPPLKEEPYCPNPQDYVESIQFQLAGYKKYNDIGGSEYVEVMTTWEKLAIELLEESSIKNVLGRKKQAKNFIQQIISEKDSDKEKIKKIYSWVQNNLNWNGEYRLFPENKFEAIIKAGRGSSSEINLVLVRLLKSAGLEANPIAISTKRNGLITKVYPLYYQFNHLLAQVEIDGKDLLMDAISDFYPYNLLSKNDLNPLGYLLNKKNPRWVDIPITKKTKTIVVNEISVQPKKMVYKTNFSFFKHEASNHRKFLSTENGKETYVKKYLMNIGDESEIKLDSFSIKNQYDLEKPLGVTCYFSHPLEEGLNADIIYLSPFLTKHFRKNPFNNPVRYLPIDFGVPFMEKFISIMILPKGYEVADVPDNINLTTSDKKCNYLFLFQENNQNVQFSSELNLKDPLISPTEYNGLREIFTQLIAMQELQLILKKK